MDGQPAFAVFLTMRVKPGCTGRFERAIAQVAAGVAANPASLGQAVFRDAEDELTYHVTSEWRSEPEFREHERSAGHRRAIAPLRDLRVDSRMEAMHLVRRLGGNEGS